MNDLGGIDTHSREPAVPGHRGQHAVLGMRAVEVIGHAPSKPVKLDAGTDQVSIFCRGVECHRQMLGFEHLKLQRHRQSIFGSAIAKPDQRFAAFEHRPTGQRLQSIEVGEPCGIGVDSPITPQCLNGFAYRGLRHHRLRLDAGTDGVCHVGLERRIGPGIATHQITALGAQLVLGEKQRRDGTGIADRPGQRATTAANSIIDGGAAEEFPAHAAKGFEQAHQVPFDVVTRICRGARGHRPVSAACS